MDVLIFEGMRVGILEGDLTIGVDVEGKTDANLVVSTSYNVLPLWLRIAHENIVLSHKASKDITEKWNDNPEEQKALLLAELTPSMQVFVACGIALDALYEQLKPFAKISKADVEAWKKNKTKRAAQIAEIIKRVYKLKNDVFKAFKKNIESIIEFRDDAVHPEHEIKRTCTRPDIPVGVDWRFSAYRYDNGLICYRRTMEMFIHLYEKGASEEKVNENMKNIFKALKELGLVEDWQYLVIRTHPWRRQLYIKGRKLLASIVWQDMIANEMSPEQAAENWNLPLPAIYEIVRYCESHQELLKLEADEERRRLEARGVSVEPTTAA